MYLRAVLIFAILVIVIGVVASSAAFTVNPTHQAIVFQASEPKRVITQPGLYWKPPFIHNVMYFEKRALNLDVPAERLLLADQKA